MRDPSSLSLAGENISPQNTRLVVRKKTVSFQMQMFKPSKKNSQAFLVIVTSFCQQCPQNLHQRALVVEMYYIKTNQPSIHPAAAESPSPKAAKRRRRHLRPIHQTSIPLHFRVLQPGMVNDEISN